MKNTVKLGESVKTDTKCFKQEGPKEPDGPKFYDSKRWKKELRKQDPLAKFLKRILIFTQGRLTIYSIPRNGALHGKSAEDFVQEAIVVWLQERKSVIVKRTSSVTIRKIYNQICDDLRKEFGNREIRIAENDQMADQRPPQQRKMAQKEIMKIRVRLFDNFLSGMEPDKKRAIRVIIVADLGSMLRLLTAKHRKLLRHLVDLGYIDGEYNRLRKAVHLHRPARLRESLPDEFRDLSRGIFHVLKGDRAAKHRYLAGKLKINYRKAKIMYNNLHKDLHDFLVREVESGLLSGLSGYERAEVLARGIENESF